jgi:hypothetical protein
MEIEIYIFRNSNFRKLVLPVYVGLATRLKEQIQAQQQVQGQMQGQVRFLAQRHKQAGIMNILNYSKYFFAASANDLPVVAENNTRMQSELILRSF